MDLRLNTSFNNAKLPHVQLPGFVDDFERASTNTLGQTLDGEQWEIYDASTSTSVWGTTGNGTATMKSASFGFHIAVADAETGDGELTATLSSVGAGTDVRFGLVFRYNDISNYIRVAPGASNDARLRLQKIVNGSAVNVGSLSETILAGGDTITVRPSGELVTVLVNGTQIFSETIPEHTTATKHGLFAYVNSTGEWDSVEFIPAEG